jgi:hypothetical protein
MVSGLLLLFLSFSLAGSTVLVCNQTLSAGSTIELDEKLDLINKYNYYAPTLPWPCAILGPDESDAEPATIVLPENDCALAAEGEVTLGGRLRFVWTGSNESDGGELDCCEDGEGHGSILCSNSNLTIATGAVVSVESARPGAVVGPGGFWAGNRISVDGRVEATLARGGSRMTGVNGLISATGVRVSATGAVVVSGQDVARGAAIQGGDDGAIIDGVVECSAYTSSDAGGCVAGGDYASVGDTGSITAHNAACFGSGCVLEVGKGAKEGWEFRGTIEAEHVWTFSAGGVVSGDSFAMAGNASIAAKNVTARGSGSVVAVENLTLRDGARLSATGQWGGDGGVVAATLTKLSGDAAIFCADAYADNCGACLLSSVELEDRASITARNATGGSLGGAICGGYPGMYISVQGGASIDVQGASAGLYGGALLAHDVRLGGSGSGSGGGSGSGSGASTSSDAFSVRLRDVEAACGGAVVVLDADNRIGAGPMSVDGSGGGALVVEDARERNASLGCLSITAALTVDGSSAPFDQPCSNCADPDFPDDDRKSCTCGLQDEATVTECCTYDESE